MWLNIITGLKILENVLEELPFLEKSVGLGFREGSFFLAFYFTVW